MAHQRNKYPGQSEQICSIFDSLNKNFDERLNSILDKENIIYCLDMFTNKLLCFRLNTELNKTVSVDACADFAFEHVLWFRKTQDRVEEVYESLISFLDKELWDLAIDINNPVLSIVLQSAK